MFAGLGLERPRHAEPVDNPVKAFPTMRRRRNAWDRLKPRMRGTRSERAVKQLKIAEHESFRISVLRGVASPQVV
jgi:hypothetical protein